MSRDLLQTKADSKVRSWNSRLHRCFIMLDSDVFQKTQPTSCRLRTTRNSRAADFRISLRKWYPLTCFYIAHLKCACFYYNCNYFFLFGSSYRKCIFSAKICKNIVRKSAARSHSLREWRRIALFVQRFGLSRVGNSADSPNYYQANMLPKLGFPRQAFFYHGIDCIIIRAYRPFGKKTATARKARCSQPKE